MVRYFKLVCLHDDVDWYLREFQAGRARFGWSGPGSDLRKLREKDWNLWTDDQRVTWSYTKFLVERIVVGDRVVIQTERPLARFLIGEVIQPGYDFSPGNLDDFNHFLHIRPLTPEPIPVNSTSVSAALKHDLSKRGQYYEIYPENSIQELDELVHKISESVVDLNSMRTDADTFDQTLRNTKRHIIDEISRRWPGKEFEKFCEFLCAEVDFIEVKERKDTGQGWDILIRIINPLTQTILLDDIPVQCKNYSGDVSSVKPIDDLERCVRNSNASVAYLMILGQLTKEFMEIFQLRQAILAKDLGNPVQFELVDEDRIAELYAAYISGKNSTKKLVV